MTNERRQFQRIVFDAQTTLSSENFKTRCELHDISLQGALVTTEDPVNKDMKTPLLLTIVLSDQQHTISMHVTIAHQTENFVGLECQHVDLESISRLRRIVELNLGDTSSLDRELEALCT